MKIDAEARERLEALRDELRREAEASIPDDYADRGMRHKYLKGDNAASGMSDASDRIDAILYEAETPAPTPSKAEALEALGRLRGYARIGTFQTLWEDWVQARNDTLTIYRYIEQAKAVPTVTQSMVDEINKKEGWSGFTIDDLIMLRDAMLAAAPKQEDERGGA